MHQLYDTSIVSEVNSVSFLSCIPHVTLICYLFFRYMQKNVQYANSYRKYDESVPAFLRDKPRSFVQHVCRRWTSAEDFGAEAVTQHSPTSYSVRSIDSENTYAVTFGDSPHEMPHCTCQDWQRTLLPCKHFCAVFKNVDGSWHQVAADYRNSPYFTLDWELFQTQDNVNELQSSAAVTDDGSSIGDDEDPNNEPVSEQRVSDNVESYESLAQVSRQMLKQVVDWTYLSTDVAAITQLNESLNNAMIDFKMSIPHEDSLALSACESRTSKKRSVGLKIRHKQKMSVKKSKHRNIVTKKVNQCSRSSSSLTSRALHTKPLSLQPCVTMQRGKKASLSTHEAQPVKAQATVTSVPTSQPMTSVPSQTGTTSSLSNLTSKSASTVTQADVASAQTRSSTVIKLRSWAQIPKASSLRKVTEHAKPKRKVRFGELNTIHDYFAPNDSDSGTAVKRQRRDVAERTSDDIFSGDAIIMKATKAHIADFISQWNGRKMSCGSYTLHDEDLFSLIPGTYLSDNVSWPHLYT